MSSGWNLDPEKDQYYWEWKDSYGTIHREYDNSGGPPEQVAPEPDPNPHHDSTYRPTSSSSRSRTHRAPVASRSGKDPVRKTDRYAGSDSKKRSSKSHDTRGSGTSPQQYDYDDTVSGHDGGPHAEPMTTHASTTDNLAGRMRSMSISDDAAYTTVGSTQATQDPSQQTDLHTASTLEQSQKLDQRYQVRNYDYKKFFRVGRVFQTLWTESYSDTTAIDETFVSVVLYDEKVHSKIRRFVVVRQNDTYCTCLPITSYDGRGHKKKGIRLPEHSFIYSHNKPKDVDGIDKRPLKVVLSKGADKLKERSLVNYARPCTVETNVKVKDVGDLDPDSRKLLCRYFKEVILPDDDTSGPVPPMNPQIRAATFAGMGAGVSSAPNYQYPPSQPTSPYAHPIHNPAYPSPSIPAGNVNYAPNSYGPTMSSPFTAPFYDTSNASGYHPEKSEDTTYGSYEPPANQHGYFSGGSVPTMGGTMGGAEYTDPPYQRDEAHGAGTTQYTSYSTPHVASVPRSSRADTKYHSAAGYSRSHPHDETIDEEDIVLPTPSEVRESRHRRDSTTSSSRNIKHRRR